MKIELSIPSSGITPDSSMYDRCKRLVDCTYDDGMVEPETMLQVTPDKNLHRMMSLPGAIIRLGLAAEFLKMHRAGTLPKGEDMDGWVRMVERVSQQIPAGSVKSSVRRPGKGARRIRSIL